MREINYNRSKGWYLSQRMAERCEMAKEKVCKCHCGGEAHGKGRIGKGGDFSDLPITDPHYRPPQELTTAAKVTAFLRDAINKVQFPRMVDRDEYSKLHGFDAWLEINKKEYAAYHECRDILADAIKRVKAMR